MCVSASATASACDDDDDDGCCVCDCCFYLCIFLSLLLSSSSSLQAMNTALPDNQVRDLFEIGFETTLKNTGMALFAGCSGVFSSWHVVQRRTPRNHPLRRQVPSSCRACVLPLRDGVAVHVHVCRCHIDGNTNFMDEGLRCVAARRI